MYAILEPWFVPGLSAAGALVAARIAVAVLQRIARQQPIRLDDVVIVEGEWGRIEEIGRTFVVIA